MKALRSARSIAKQVLVWLGHNCWMMDRIRCLPFSLGLPALRRALLSLLACLVLIQTVGLVHRVAHVPDLHDRIDHPASSLSFLWADHGSTSDCQLFDHACPDLLHTAAPALTTAPNLSAWSVPWYKERGALFERFFAARAPPETL